MKDKLKKIVLKRFIIILVLISFGLTCDTWAYPKAIRRFGNTTVEMGSSNEYIMFLLANIAGMYQDYLAYIYGHYRGGFVLITMQTYKKKYDLKKMEDLIKNVVNNVMNFYPESEGDVSLELSADEFDSLRFTFKNGVMKDESIHLRAIEQPVETNEQRIMKKEFKKKQLEGELICDLNNGYLAGIRVGDYINPEKVIKTIGEIPSSTSFGNYYFAITGVMVQVANEKFTGKNRVFGFTIYPGGANFTEFQIKNFKGKIIPYGFNEKDTEQSIRREIGSPNKIKTEWGITLLYNKSYGELEFHINKQSGKLMRIEMSLQR